MKMRKGGFTLVELLIVIMIIAILAGMMMLATGSATDSAEAARIISDLRTIKGAAALFRLDSGRWPATADITSLDQYMDRKIIPDSTDQKRRYVALIITSYDSGTRANIGLTFGTDGPVSLGVKSKLESKAQDSGLLGKGDDGETAYKNEGTVYMNMY
jgi:general secretion pathway protein G